MNAIIYILEDDESINKLLKYALENSGFIVKSFLSFEEFKLELDKEIPQILILDIMLGNISGFEVLKDIKNNQKTAALEVILLSAISSESDKVKGFELGASDYITKPFSVLELIARVKNILKRLDLRLTFKDLLIDEKSRKAYVKENELLLTLKEFELLKYLVLKQKICISKEELMVNIWGANISSRTLDIHINTLRNKLKDYSKYIITIRGVGYILDDEN